MELFLDTLRRNEDAKIIVGFPGEGQADRFATVAYVHEEVSLKGQAMYSEPANEVYGQFANVINSAMNNVGAIAGGAAMSGVGSSMINRQFRTIWSTISTWTNTSKFGFSLQMRFYAMEETDDVRKPALLFLRCVNPIFDDKVPAMVQAPNAYDFTENTCLSVRIGRWLRIPPLLLVKQTGWRFSKETIPSGLPLYAEGNVDFEAYRMLSADEVATFLVGLGA